MRTSKRPVLHNLPQVFPVACHTDNIGPGSTFVAIRGTKLNGSDYIPCALKKGATKVVIDQSAQLGAQVEQLLRHHNVELVRVQNTRLALAQLSVQALGFPAKKLKIIGITGTKGKSTTTFLLEHILRSAGLKTAMLSTVTNRINGVDTPTKLTTQQPDYLHIFFDRCVAVGVEWVVMEVAAQAFSLHRVAELEFDAAIFTNFSQEHGEFYATMDDYFAAKCQIVDQLKSDAPLFLNKDDLQVAQLSTCSSNALFFNAEHPYHCPALIGGFNAYNIAAATQVAQSIGCLPDAIQQALTTFRGVPGRLEKYELPNGATGIIDYAHNPASYRAVLGELRKLTDHLIVVFGCGGERDASRRPLMGAIASELADIVILTSDNPRSEDAQAIIYDIFAGVNSENCAKITVELDREVAIKNAYYCSRSGSLIVLLGKGPDEYQIVQGTQYFFSEKAILQAL